jgi:hypothetical protein
MNEIPEPASERSENDTERTTEHFKDLFSLTEEEQRLLKERVEKHQGNIRIMVHPFMEWLSIGVATDMEWRKYLETSKMKANVIKAGLLRMLELDEASTAPVFIMEEKQNIESLEELLRMLLGEELNNPPIIIKTEADSPFPIGNGDLKYPEQTAMAWHVLAKKFEGIGVKHAIVGGQYLLEIQDTGSNTKYSTAGACVGQTLDSLSKYFEVEASALAHPHSRKDFK